MTAVHPIASLRRFVRSREVTSAQERCDLCHASVGIVHRHLFDTTARRLTCACDACALLFPQQGPAKYVPVPRDASRLDDFRITDAQWDALSVPIGLAFFSRQFSADLSARPRINAVYPSPAGTTEAELPFDAWQELAAENPVLNSFDADVETLLVNRTRHHRDYYRAPVDRCYELAGTVRKHWRGLSGGQDVWEAIDRFFENLTSENFTPGDHA